MAVDGYNRGNGALRTSGWLGNLKEFRSLCRANGAPVLTQRSKHDNDTEMGCSVAGRSYALRIETQRDPLLLFSLPALSLLLALELVKEGSMPAVAELPVAAEVDISRRVKGQRGWSKDKR